MHRPDFNKARGANRLKATNEQSGAPLSAGFSQRLFEVAHDVQSPLTVLCIMAHLCDELDEEKRSVLAHSVAQIQDMMGNILGEYRSKNATEKFDEERCAISCSEIIDQILNEKKYQYLHCPVSFQKIITDPKAVCLIRVQPNQLKRAISNLINNAVDALKEKKNGNVSIILEADEHNVKIIVRDNGKGMPQDALDKLSNKVGFTAGKSNGHGLGMTQVWRMLDANSGNLLIRSKLGSGSTFELVFPKLD